MSGPKSAEYFLTLEVRMKLAEERKIKRLKEKISRISVNLYSYSKIENFLSNTVELAEKGFDDGGLSVLSDEFSKISDELEKECEKVELQKSYSELNSVYKSIKSLSEKKKSIYNEMCSVNTANLNHLKEFFRSETEKAMNTDFSSIKSSSQTEKEGLTTKITEKLQSAGRLNISEQLRTEVNNAVEYISKITELSVLKNFCAVTAVDLVKKCTEYSRIIDEFNELKLDYHVLCSEAGISPCEFEVTSENLIKLKELTAELEKNTEKSSEQAYIDKNTNEVMSEMGYSLLGERSVTKKSGKKFRSELYSFSDGTAVNVTYSSTGQIVMELAGIDTCDRFPDDDEKKYLCGEMESFCDSFSEFRRKLAKRGILAKHVSALPPDEEYAQIVNTNDYQTKADIQKINVKSNTRKRSAYSENT